MFHQFYTSDKKPHVWGIAVLTGVMILAMIILLTRPSLSLPLSIALIIGYLVLVTGMLIIAFFRQLRYDPYSYNTIYYSGFAIFTLGSLIIVLVSVTRSYFWQLPAKEAIITTFGTLMSSANNFMILSSPLVLLFALALCISNIALIRREGRRFVNILGIILSVLMVGGIAILWRFDYYFSGSFIQVVIHEVITHLYAAVYLYFECMVIGTIISMIIVTTYKPRPEQDHILILGCGIKKDGTPTPLLRGRVDRALDFAQAQAEQTGKAPLLVPSGGQGPDEVCSESQSMADYLMTRGVPEEQILMEDRSASTFENMKFCRDLLRQRGGEGAVAFSTTNYHVFRSGLMARRVGMKAVGMGSKTKWYFWPNAAVREFVGLLTDERLKQAVVLLCMVVFYVAIAILFYQF